MSDRETGVEEARKVLGKLVDDAALDGAATYLTRRGRRYAAIVPLDRIKETVVTDTTYTASIGLVSSVVAGDYCDVAVHENVVVGVREDDHGNEIPVTEGSGPMVLETTELDVRTDDEDSEGKAYAAADIALSINGWSRTGPWSTDDTAAYAPVERD